MIMEFAEQCFKRAVAAARNTTTYVYYIYIYIYICIYVCMYVCMYVYIYIYIYTHMHQTSSSQTCTSQGLFGLRPVRAPLIISLHYAIVQLYVVIHYEWSAFTSQEVSLRVEAPEWSGWINSWEYLYPYVMNSISRINSWEYQYP